METLICPQCGAQLDETHVTGDTVRCSYCATQFHVSRPQPVLQPHPELPAQQFVVNYTPVRTKGVGAIVAVPLIMMLMIFTFIGGVFYFVFSSVNRTVGGAVNSALSTANDAQTAANAMKAAANAAREKANAAAAAANAAANAARERSNANAAPRPR